MPLPQQPPPSTQDGTWLVGHHSSILYQDSETEGEGGRNTGVELGFFSSTAGIVCPIPVI